jgi:hypothetical protein
MAPVVEAVYNSDTDIKTDLTSADPIENGVISDNGPETAFGEVCLD